MITVAGAEYFLTANDDPDRAADRFLLNNMRNADPEHPSLVASQKHPLMISVDGVIVRAWPAFIPRDRGAKTYVNQATGDRVAAVKDQPVWMFAGPGRPPTPGGTTFYEQTVDDVIDLAKVWLRSADG